MSHFDIELMSTEFLLCAGCFSCTLSSNFTTPFPDMYDRLHFKKADCFDEALGLRKVK